MTADIFRRRVVRRAGGRSGRSSGLEHAMGAGFAPDPARRLVSALLALADGRGALVIHRETPWASITFAGARHCLRFVFAGAEAVEAGERLIAEAPEHEFAIPRQIVADVQVIGVEHRLLPEPRLTVELEILMLEES